MAAADPDSDTLFYTAAMLDGTKLVDQLPVGAMFNPLAGILTWRPTFDQAGSYAFRITASDGHLSRSEDITVEVLDVNRAPIFSGSPRLLAREGDDLNFVVPANDPDGEQVQLRLIGDYPAGLVLDPFSGYIQWTPDFDSAGIHTIGIAALDSACAAGTTEIQVQVLPVNRAPTLDLPITRTIVLGESLELPIDAIDPDGDPITLSARDLPPGAVLDDATALLKWTPEAFQLGAHTTRIAASDGEQSVARSIELLVVTERPKPQVQLVVTPGFPVTPGTKVLIEPVIDSILPVASVSGTGNTQAHPLSVDQLGRFVFIPDTVGRFEFEITVTDTDGVATTAKAIVCARDAADTTPPEFAFDGGTSLTPEEFFLGFNVIEDSLDEYTIELIPQGDDAGTLLVRETESGRSSITVDLRKFENGFYTLRFHAVDLGGLETTEALPIEIDNDAKPTAYETSATDIEVVLGGVTVPFVRRYSSLCSKVQGSLGVGWTVPLVDPRVEISEGPDEPLNQSSSLFLTRPDGARSRFSFTPIVVTTDTLTYYHPGFSNTSDGWSLVARAAQLTKAGRNYYVLGSGLPYQPSVTASRGDWSLQLTSPDGTRYRYADPGDGYQLFSIIASDGRQVRWTDTGMIAADNSRVSLVEKCRRILVGADRTRRRACCLCV